MASIRSAQASVADTCTMSGLVFAVSFMSAANRAIVACAEYRARRIPSIVADHAPLVAQLARMEPVDTSCQSIQVLLSHSSSDSMPVKIAKLDTWSWRSPSAPLASDGQRIGLSSEPLAKFCGS